MLNEYKFVICLEGSGQDLHRFYETLLVGSIPIAIDNSITALFEYWKVPGIFLENWDFLNKVEFKGNYCFDNVQAFLEIQTYKNIITNV